MKSELISKVEEIAEAMQKSYEADIDLLTRRDKAHQERIAHYTRLLEAVPVDDIEYIIARYFFQVERGQNEHLDRINAWLDKVKPIEENS